MTVFWAVFAAIPILLLGLVVWSNFDSERQRRREGERSRRIEDFRAARYQEIRHVEEMLKLAEDGTTEQGQLIDLLQKLNLNSGEWAEMVHFAETHQKPSLRQLSVSRMSSVALSEQQ